MPKAFSTTLRVYVTIMLCLWPLWADATGYGNLTAAKSTLLWIITLVAIPTCMIMGDMRLGKHMQAQYEKKHNKVFLFILCLLVLSLIITALLAGDPFETLLSERGAIFHLGYLAIFLFFGLFGRWEWSYCNDMTIAVGLNALIVTLQVGGKNPLSLYPSGVNYYDAGILYSGEYLGTLGNTNILSVWLILALVLCTGAVLCAERKIQRFIGAVGCVAATYTGFLADTLSFRLAAPVAFLVIGFFVVASGRALLHWISAFLFGAGGISLGACVSAAVSNTGKASVLLFASIILLVFGVAIWGLIEYLEKKKPKGKKGISKRWSSAWFSVIICLGAASLVAVYFMPTEQLKSILYELHEILHGRVEDSFGSHRVLIWKETLASFSQKPLFGFGEPFSDYVQIVFNRITENGVELSAVVEDAHNIFLSWLHHNGIVGTALAVVVIGIVLWRCLRSGSVSARLCAAAVVMYLFISMFCVAGFFTDPLFWMLMGISVCESGQSLQETKKI